MMALKKLLDTCAEGANSMVVSFDDCCYCDGVRFLRFFVELGRDRDSNLFFCSALLGNLR